jgi:hypothetical protein
MCYLVSASSSFCFNELCSLIEYSVTLRPVRSLVPVSRFTCFEGGWPDIMSGYLGKRPVPETCKSVFSLICVFKRFLTFWGRVREHSFRAGPKRKIIGKEVFWSKQTY